MCICIGFFFLTTLDIYKNYFNGRLTGRNWMKLDAKVLFKHIVTGDEFALVHLSHEKVTACIHCRVL